jgi:NADH:ubiquinone oxidoreductase subunit B-like Fe-S oxidoreductase
MPQPKFVVAIGACACSGGVFAGNYNVVGGVDKVIPVTAYIPGCPPRPEAILDGVVKLLNALNPPKPKKQPKQEKQPELPKEEIKPTVAQPEVVASQEVKPVIEEAKPDAKQ